MVEFVGASFTEWASLVAGVLYFASFVALAVTVMHTSNEDWVAGRGPLRGVAPLPDWHGATT